MRCLLVALGCLLAFGRAAGALTPTPTRTRAPFIQFDIQRAPTATPAPTHAHKPFFQFDDQPQPSGTPGPGTPTPTPTGPTRTPTITQTPTATQTRTPTFTPTCPAVCEISGTVYRVDGTGDANDTLTFFSTITSPTTLAGCVVNPMPPVTTTTNAQGVMRPIRLPMGLPISVTLANGGGSPVQTYVPYVLQADFADVLAESLLSRNPPINQLAPPNGPVSFNFQDLLDVGSVSFVPVTFANLGPAAPTGKTVYCSDCTNTQTCAAGGLGALAVANAGGWQCE